jgi:hypothetical protein
LVWGLWLLGGGGVGGSLFGVHFVF